VWAGENGWRRHDYDDIDVEPNHLRCEIGESLGVALGIPALYDKVSALFVSELPQPAEQLRIKRLAPVRDEPHPPDLARLLRPCTKRPLSDSNARKDNKIAPSHGFTTLTPTILRRPDWKMNCPAHAAASPPSPKYVRFHVASSALDR
jgi:hypothetical protein